MNKTDGLKKMTEIVSLAAERFTELGITAKIETDYMNRMLGPVGSIEKAKYITVTLILSTDEIQKDEEYCLSLGAEIKGSNIDDSILEKSIANFEQMIEETVDKLSEYENKTEAITVLAQTASEEVERLMEKIKASEKKQRLITYIGIAVIIVIFVILMGAGLF